MITPDISPGFRQRFDEARGGDAAGGFGNALQFDGVNDEVNLDSLISAAGAFGWGCWFKPTTDTDSAARVLLSYLGVNSLFYEPDELGQIRTQMSSGSFTSITYTGLTLVLNAWNHVVLTRNSGNFMGCYLNGVKSGIAPFNNELFNVLKFGRASTSRPMDGVLDEFYYYTSEITAGEVTSLYNGGEWVDITTVKADPVGHWKYDQSEGTNLPDTGSGGNNGTLANFADPASSWILHE